MTRMEECELLEMNPPIQKDETIFEEYIDTGFGEILVARQGNPIKPDSNQCCIITFHDLGMNYLSNFQSFFNYHLMRPVTARMPVIHINAPGQEDGASDLSDDYAYPSMDQLADSVRTVCNYYGIKQTICLGVGLGANVMARVAAKNPDLVDGLFILNPIPTSAGFPQCIIDYFIWYHFGSPSEERSQDLMNMYKSYISSHKIRPKNLAFLIESYLARDDIGVERTEGKDIKCSSLVLCGNDSPFLEDSINMNQRLLPDRSTWMKLFDCGLPVDEQPDKVSEAFILFVQGLGLGLLTCYKYK